MRVLIIENDESLAGTLQRVLSKTYAVDVCSLGQEGLLMATTQVYDLIILDLGLPDIDGRTVCINLRKTGINTPILVYTGKSKLQDKIDLLDLGADDYIVKPASLAEIQAHIRALLRRLMNQLLTIRSASTT